MFPLWLILGTFLILAAIFNRQMLRFLGLKPMSEVIITKLKSSSRTIEQIERWLLISLGVNFLVLGLDGALPDNISHTISFLLLGLSGLLLVAIVGITIANWKAK
ncbi:MAG: hypothetical protein ROW48_13830 [Bellilinea sp.]|jgi:hypothetical protein